MDRIMKIAGILAGLLAAAMAIALFSYLGDFQGALLGSDLFSGASPLGVFAVFAVLLFGGIYFFTAAGHIIKEAVK